MGVKTEPENGNLDAFKWGLVFLLIIAGIGADYYFKDIARTLKLAAWIPMLGIVGGIALQTAKGKMFQAFSGEARTELRKVVWPTRPETVQSTIMVVVMVIIMSLLLWGIDSALMWVVQRFTV